MLNLCKFFVKFLLRTPRAGAAPYGPTLVLLAGFWRFGLKQPHMAAGQSFLGPLKSSAPAPIFRPDASLHFRLPDAIIPLPAFKFNLRASKPNKILEKRNILSKRGAFYLTNVINFVIIFKKAFISLTNYKFFVIIKGFGRKNRENNEKMVEFSRNR